MKKILIKVKDFLYKERGDIFKLVLLILVVAVIFFILQVKPCNPEYDDCAPRCLKGGC